MEMVSLFATQPNTGLAASVAAGNSLTIRNNLKRAFLLGQSGARQTDGFLRLTSPELHDSSVGIQQQYDATGSPQYVLYGQLQPLQSQDTLTALISGSNTAGDIETNQLHIWYEDLPGVDAKLITSDELKKSAVELFEVSVSLTAVATGEYGPAVAINSSQDQFKANRSYAILGVSPSGNVGASHAYRILGPDTGNLGIGCPGSGGIPISGSTFFQKLSDASGLPTIPVISSPNKGLTTIQQIGNENAGTITATILMALLRSGK